MIVTGHAVDWNGTPEYQFWMEDATGWHLVQNYSPNASWSLTLSPGSYAIAVYAMNPDAITAGYWNQAVESTVILNVDSTVSLSANPSATAGQSTTFTAQAENLIDPVYQFWVENPSGTWQGTNYTSSSVYGFTPLVAGTYRVIVYAKDPVALANPSDAVWSQCETVTVAPSVPSAAAVTTSLSNALPGFATPNVVLLGEKAWLTTVVTDSSGKPLANVPVVFTAVNDTNPSDHVTFSDGLSTTVVTNQNGVAQTPLIVTNPEDESNGSLAFDPSAVTTVSYAVSIPSDSAMTPATGSVRFAALEPPSVSANGALLQNGAIPLTSGTTDTLDSTIDFLVPGVASAMPYSISLTSGAHEATIKSAFTAATINVADLSLAAGGSAAVSFIPNGTSTPAYTRTFQGPMSEQNFGIQIPSDGPGTLTFAASGQDVFSVSSITVYPSGAPATFTEPALDAYLAWQVQPVEENAPEAISSAQAQALLGSYYSASSTYTVQIPVYPEAGDAVITAMSSGSIAVQYAYPVQNNGQGQNVLAPSGTAMPLPAAIWNNALTLSGTNPASISSSQTGLTGLKGSIVIPAVDSNLLQQFPPLLGEILWMPPS